jgi:hypothetical protein
LQLQLLPEGFVQAYQVPALTSCAFTVVAALSSVNVNASMFCGFAAFSE